MISKLILMYLTLVSMFSRYASLQFAVASHDHCVYEHCVC
jgi:hypothetical protein